MNDAARTESDQSRHARSIARWYWAMLSPEWELLQKTYKWRGYGLSSDLAARPAPTAHLSLTPDTTLGAYLCSGVVLGSHDRGTVE